MDLTQLIHTHRGDRTYRQLETACHGKLTHQRWQQLATHHPRAFPTPDTITAVATGLGITERAVLLAAGQSLGLPVNAKPRFADLIPAATDRLPPAAAAAVLACINAMIAIHEGLGL